MAWKPLNISASAAAHLPPLLISYTFTAGSYSVHLTDITHIWSESLSRRAIIERSREEATSIDPSDTDQFQIFVDKLKAGLAGGKDTALALTVSSGADRPSLTLNVNVKLPGSLAALEWPIRLSASPQELLTSQLTLPLLEAQHERIQELESLVNMLGEKDHVIQKLLDVLEGQGTELGQAFPQAAGKGGRKIGRKQAEERVKGLGPFDVSTWRAGFGYEGVGDMAQLMQNVFFKEVENRVSTERKVPISNNHDDWWDSMKGITVSLSFGNVSTNGKPKMDTAQPVLKPEKEHSDEEMDDFQVQETPPRWKPKLAHPAQKSLASESTDDDDDDDLDAPSQRSKVPDSFSGSPPHATSSSKPKKLGTTGGRKVSAKISSAPINEEETTQDEASIPSRKKTPQKKKPFKVVAPLNESGDSTEDETPLPRSSPKKKLAPQRKATKAIVTTEKDESTDDSSGLFQNPVTKKGSASKDEIPVIPDGNKAEEDSPNKDETPAARDKPTAKPRETIGKIGGKQHVSPPSSEVEQHVPLRPNLPSPAPTTSKPKKSKFTIGGKKKQTEPTELREELFLQPEASTSTTIRNKMIGHIGHDLQASSDSEPQVKAEVESQSRGRVAIRPKEPSPEPRETSLERADRKRQELKRELEQKAAAPIKKKRKF